MLKLIHQGTFLFFFPYSCFGLVCFRFHPTGQAMRACG